MCAKKISTSEVGHAKNISHFELLIEICEGFGATYSPSNGILQLEALNTKLHSCEDDMESVQNTRTPLMHVVNARQVVFMRLKPLCTRVMNSLSAVAEDKLVIADARTFNRKIQGKASLPQVNEEQEGQETAKELSNSQQSYDKLIENFSLLISFLEGVDAYASITDEEVNISDLKAFLEELKSANKAVLKPFVAYRRALNARKENMYDKATGLLMVAKLVKHYTKGRYGAVSDEYKMLSGLEFRYM